MARSAMNAKLFSALVSDGLSSAISRCRGYASAPHGVAASVARGVTGAKKAAEEAVEKSSWVPDPVTGYYRPERVAGEVDVAELRAMLLKNKANNN